MKTRRSSVRGIESLVSKQHEQIIGFDKENAGCFTYDNFDSDVIALDSPQPPQPIKLLFKRESETSYNVLRVQDSNVIPRVIEKSKYLQSIKLKNYSGRRNFYILTYKDRLPKKSISCPIAKQVPLAVSKSPKKRGRKPKCLQLITPKSTSCPLHLNAFNVQSARVVIERKPLRIALVDANTDVVQTEAILLLDLFKTRTAPCIFCPKCNVYMSVKAFGSHFHIDMFDRFDAETRRLELEALKRKTYKTLPCLDNDQETLSSQKAERWAYFLRLVEHFKIFTPTVELEESM